jgi:hypothetical protein
MRFMLAVDALTESSEKIFEHAVRLLNLSRDELCFAYVTDLEPFLSEEEKKQKGRDYSTFVQVLFM